MTQCAVSGVNCAHVEGSREHERVSVLLLERLVHRDHRARHVRWDTAR